MSGARPLARWPGNDFRHGRRTWIYALRCAPASGNASGLGLHARCPLRRGPFALQITKPRVWVARTFVDHAGPCGARAANRLRIARLRFAEPAFRRDGPSIGDPRRGFEWRDSPQYSVEFFGCVASPAVHIVGVISSGSASSADRQLLTCRVPGNWHAAGGPRWVRYAAAGVTAVGSVQDGGASGFAPSTVLLLVWDPIVLNAGQRRSMRRRNRRTRLRLTRCRSRPGRPQRCHPQVAVVHDQPGGGADLLYGVNSIGGNSGQLLIGIVHYVHQIATLTYSDHGDEAHVGTFDVPTTASPGFAIVGAVPTSRYR